MADVLDAYALVALIAGEPAEALVEEILRSGDAAITSINFGEAIDVSCRVHGLDTNAVRGVVEPLVLDGHLSVRAVDETSAWRAAQLRVGYYDRRACAISIADCFLLAAAGPDDRVATADPAVAAVAKAEAITVLPLPDSSGRRP